MLPGFQAPPRPSEVDPAKVDLMEINSETGDSRQAPSKKKEPDERHRALFVENDFHAAFTRGFVMCEKSEKGPETRSLEGEWRDPHNPISVGRPQSWAD
jgi:hypothetical protein